MNYFMQNKPNHKKAKMNVTDVLTKQYENSPLQRQTENKPKQTQLFRYLPHKNFWYYADTAGSGILIFNPFDCAPRFAQNGFAEQAGQVFYFLFSIEMEREETSLRQAQGCPVS